jgi:NAD(P)-dependent dehydrogenase (short-subunit alcohol dehydrogenase family)
VEDIRQNVPSYFPDKVNFACSRLFTQNICTDHILSQEGADAALATMVPPTGRDTKPEEVASLVSFLVSKEASMITGTDSVDSIPFSF